MIFLGFEYYLLGLIPFSSKNIKNFYTMCVELRPKFYIFIVLFVIDLSKEENFISNPSFFIVPIILLDEEFMVDVDNAFIIIKLFFSSFFTIITPLENVTVLVRNMRL